MSEANYQLFVTNRPGRPQKVARAADFLAEERSNELAWAKRMGIEAAPFRTLYLNNKTYFETPTHDGEDFSRDAKSPD